MKVRADLRLYSGENRRTTPFGSGYRPVFDNVMADSLASGVVMLTDREEMFPGEQAVVVIDFFIVTGSIPIGTKMTFSEGRNPLGEAIVIEVLSEDGNGD